MHSLLIFPLRCALALLLVLSCVSGVVRAQTVVFVDPQGDDKGPGGFEYPTDEIFTPGSFDLRKMTVSVVGSRVDLSVLFQAPLDDPWAMGVGFSLQTVFIFIDSSEGGHRSAPAGLNLHFEEDSAWETCIVLSPQQPARLRREARRLLGPLAKDLVIPDHIRGFGSALMARIRRDQLGEGDPATWGYQVAVLANDNLPSPGSLFTRRIEETAGRSSFGGSQGACGPNVLDVLGPHEQLLFECRPDGTARKEATLSMAHAGLDHAPSSALFGELQETLPKPRSESAGP